MRLTRRQLRQIIKEAMDDSETSEELFNAMIGFVQMYLEGKGIRDKADKSFALMSVQTALLKARDGDPSAVKNLQGKDKKYYDSIKKSVTEMSDSDQKEFAANGSKVKAV